MTPAPSHPKIYHITHLQNLGGIMRDGILCDRTIVEHGGPSQLIGMRRIKQRRIEEHKVDCHPGTMVGDYVPFNFCPRSVMLFVIHRKNHPELDYLGGQEPILHLEADLREVVAWADAHSVRWAFTLSNAGARYTEFRSRLDDLDELNWEAIRGTDFRSPSAKEGKQAEFLLEGQLPFALIERIGVHSDSVRVQVLAALQHLDHAPVVEVRRDWYY